MSKRLSFNDIKHALAGAEVHKAKSKGDAMKKALGLVHSGLKSQQEELLKNAKPQELAAKKVGSFSHDMPKAPTNFKPVGDLTPPGTLYKAEIKK